MEVQGVEVTNVITGAKCNKGARCNTELVPNVIRNGSQGSLNYIIKGGGVGHKFNYCPGLEINFFVREPAGD